jgi:DNA-directed RNA polymerase subunit alpha
MGYIDVKGPAVVTAKDIKFDGDIGVSNPDHYIATLDKDGKLKLEMKIKAGWGYVLAESTEEADLSVSEISVDAIYTPMRAVNFITEKTRVKNRTDYDKLTLELRTDGSITPAAAISIAAKIIMEHLKLFVDLNEVTENLDVLVETEKEDRIAHSLNTRVEDIGLNQRSLNGLKRAGINTIEDIISLTEEELINTRHIGEKSVDDIKERVHVLGFKFKGE